MGSIESKPDQGSVPEGGGGTTPVSFISEQVTKYKGETIQCIIDTFMAPLLHNQRRRAAYLSQTHGRWLMGLVTSPINPTSHRLHWMV
jgi:hypothetical protein